MPKIIKQCYRDKTEQGSRHLFRFIMLTLLAESKTMASNQSEISPDLFKQHTPVLENIADSIMEYLASLPINEISKNLGISNQLAIKAHNFAYEFPHKVTGIRALKAFIGEAYRALDVNSLPEEVFLNIDDKLKIISSVYGILNPSDIIKPYRSEFNKPISADNNTAIQIFKPKVTIEFVKFIKENKVSEIIDLLPADADKCLDWKIIRAFASVQKICFQVFSNQGKLKTPIASRLKELRGLMARNILANNITSFDLLKSMETEHYVFSPEYSKTGLPVFIASEK